MTQLVIHDVTNIEKLRLKDIKSENNSIAVIAPKVRDPFSVKVIYTHSHPHISTHPHTSTDVSTYSRTDGSVSKRLNKLIRPPTSKNPSLRVNTFACQKIAEQSKTLLPALMKTRLTWIEILHKF